MGKIKSNIRTVAISDIQVPKELYPRASMPQEKDVQHLIGVDFPAITIAEVINPTTEDLAAATALFLVDGAHRMLANELQGQAEITAEVLELSYGEVLSEAIQRNATHGKQLSMRDKEKVATGLIADGWKIADLVGLLSVGERTVSRWVADAKEAKKLKDYAGIQRNIKKGMSVAGAAREVGVARSTAQGWIDNPPEAKPKAPKQESFDEPEPLDTKQARKSLGQERIDAVVEMIVEFAKDSAKEIEAAADDGADFPHWTEVAEAAIEDIRKSYPRGWKVK
jgi:transposase